MLKNLPSSLKNESAIGFLVNNSKKHKISQKPKNHHEKGRFGHESENEKFDRYIDLPGAKKLTL